MPPDLPLMAGYGQRLLHTVHLPQQVFVFVFVSVFVFVFVLCQWINWPGLPGLVRCGFIRSSLKGLEQFGTLKPKCRDWIGLDIPDHLDF